VGLYHCTSWSNPCIGDVMLNKWEHRPNYDGLVFVAKDTQSIPDNCTVQDLLNWCRRIGVCPKDVRITHRIQLKGDETTSAAFAETTWKKFSSFKGLSTLRVKK